MTRTVQGDTRGNGMDGPAVEPDIGGVRGFIRLLRRFVPFTFPYWDKILLRIVYRFAYSVIGVLGAMATVRLVDDGLSAKDTEAFLMWSTVKVLLTAHILVFVAVYANICHYVFLRLNIAFKRRMFNHVQRMAMAFHQKRPLGENMYRINSDTEAATDFAANAVPEPLEWIVDLLISSTLLFALNPIVGGILASYIVLYYLFSHVVVGRMYVAQRRVRRSEQQVAAVLQETYAGFVATKAMSRERRERRRYFERLTGLMRARLSYFSFLAVWMDGAELLREIVISQMGHLLFCGYLVMEGHMTIGEFIAVVEMINLVQGPIRSLVATIQRLRVAAVPAQRMLETLDILPETPDKQDAVNLIAPRGEIRFDRVSFRYAPDGAEVLKELTFIVEAGRKVAIVGLSGAGKTSIFNLLMRFADPTGGRVLIDGIDLRDLKLQSYLEHVSVVLQDNFLFSATVRDNILVGNPEADDAQLLDAIKRSGLESTLAALPQGLDTMLLEGGNLSVGQKQRIGIARALLRDPQFLYLDEATSALDPATEEEITEQIREIEEGRTCLVIAHHISSVSTADEILVMDAGRLVQRGRHEELIAQQGGAYHRLWAAERSRQAPATGVA